MIGRDARFVDAQECRIKSIEAPVVPMRFARIAPSASSPVFTAGVERPVMLT